MDEPQYSSETSEIMNKLDSGEITETPAKEKATRPLDAATCSPSSDTPETQTKVKRICGNWNNAGDRVQEFVLADFARKLERERDQLYAAIRNLRDVKGRHHTQIAAERLFALLPENFPPVA